MFSTGFGLPKGLLETVGKTLDTVNAQDRVYAKLLEDFGVTTPNELSESRQDEFLTKGIELLGEGHAMVNSLKKRIAERASHATVTAVAEKIAGHKAPDAPKKKVNEEPAEKPIADMSRGGGKTEHQKDVEKSMRSEESVNEASNEAPGIPHLGEEIDLSEEQIAEAGDKVTAFMKGFDAEKHEVMYNGKKHKIVTKSKVADHKEKGWKIRRTVSGLSKGLAEETLDEAKKNTYSVHVEFGPTGNDAREHIVKAHDKEGAMAAAMKAHKKSGGSGTYHASYGSIAKLAGHENDGVPIHPRGAEKLAAHKASMRSEESIEEAKKLAGYKGPMKMVTVKDPKTDKGKDAKKGGGGVFKLPARKYDPSKYDLAETRRIDIVKEAMGKKLLKKEEDDDGEVKGSKTLTGQPKDTVDIDAKMKDNIQNGGPQIKSGTT